MTSGAFLEVLFLYIPLSDKIINDLSYDACICYKYCQAIRTGKLTTQLAELKSGPIVYSRGLTTGEALLFMWTRKHGLTGKNLENLETLVRFFLNSYFKLFLDIKVKYDINHGPSHVLTGPHSPHPSSGSQDHHYAIHQKWIMVQPQRLCPPVSAW